NVRVDATSPAYQSNYFYYFFYPRQNYSRLFSFLSYHGFTNISN
ncbi:MAG: hypothetical protein ACI9W5_000023, partial [Ulvibacter sp.]